ncbi:hypothetical protein KOR34_52240 [Posidoniimonas corsicana]|uniref:Uncharacterized protein n=1 Tax=Posidoniimonas corsicana TaxID=1938618 RepID=A0A5C5USG1_9BACT|nr:hypothetical protein [Posidoniimonas corsicana]TWT29314.1 hypothetical protein KOR34_52240 [Posidoniimonas corsicana]
MKSVLATKPASNSNIGYRELAEEYMDKHKCRWSDACLAIKRRYPEAIAAFGGPPPLRSSTA